MGCGTRSLESGNDRHGFNQMLKWARKECVRGYTLTFLMEPTGVYYEKLAYHLCKVGQVVYVVMPNKAREFCKYEGIKTKTDEMDARCLALLGCVNRRLTPWQPPKAIYRELRQMTRFVEEIQKVRTMLTNHLEALRHTALPVESVVKHYERLIADIDRQLEDNLKIIKAKIASDKEQEEKEDRICTIKGVGYLTVVTIIAETNGFNLITSRKQLASFAGLDVTASQSGNEDPKHVISKKGNTHIRRALYWPAISSSRFMEIVDAETGEVRSVEVFVAILPSNHYTYCEASWSQRKEDLISSYENALHFFGGVHMAIVPDNLKSAVT